MARVTPQAEDALAAKRSGKRHLHDPPFLVDANGRLVPHTRLTERNPDYRPYYGEVSATPAQRAAWYRGEQRKRTVVYNPEDEEVDIGKMNVDELVLFAMDEFSFPLNTAGKTVKQLREEVFALTNAEQNPGGGPAQVQAGGLSAALNDPRPIGEDSFVEEPDQQRPPRGAKPPARQTGGGDGGKAKAHAGAR